MKYPHVSTFNFRLATFLFFALLFASCEKVVQFEIEDIQRQVVVNALPTTDSIFFANISYSRFFLDNQEFPPVTDANVTLDVNGTAMPFSGRNGANYRFAYTVNAGDSLTLTVELPGRAPIIAGTRAVALADISGLCTEIDTLQPITTGNITFTLNDPSNEKNHYLIYIAERDSGRQWNRWEEKWDTIDTVRNAYFNCYNREITDLEVNSAEGFMDYFTQLLFSDAKIDGQSYETTLSIPMFKDTAEHPIERHYTLVLQQLSPEAHRYITEVAAAQGIGQYFAEPARIYSNIRGALGIFAAISRREIPIKFELR